MRISSRTPEGVPGDCPVCGASVRIEPSFPPGDAPCPVCGSLMWFTQFGEIESLDTRAASKNVPVTVMRSMGRMIGRFAHWIRSPFRKSVRPAKLAS